MDIKSQQEQQAAYDSEWGTPEGDDTQATERGALPDQKSDDGSTSPKAAATSNTGETSNKSADSPAVGESAGDIWANATEEQKLAYRRAENERMAAANRAKVHEDRLAERGRELKALRDANLALEEASRTPTEFEQQHEVYGKDIETMIERKLTKLLPPVAQPEEKTAAQIEQEVFDVITRAHPDAGDVYNSAECQAMLAEDPVFKHEGKAYLFSEALNSSDPNMTVIALSHFKSTRSTVSSPRDKLSGLVAPNGSSVKHDMRLPSQLTDRESYDKEWETDD